MKGPWLLVVAFCCHAHAFDWPWGSDPKCPRAPQSPQCKLGDINYPFYPHPTDERFFIHSHAYSPICKQCAPGTVWHQGLRTCSFDSGTTTAAPPGDDICPKPVPGNYNNVLVPHPSNRNLYYHCIDGVPYLRACPLDLVFNPLVSSCECD